MRADKKAAREHQKMLAWLAKNGKSVEEFKDQPVDVVEQSTYYTGIAALQYWENNNRFIERQCSSCGRMFAVNYKFVSCCSEKCVKKALEEIGLTYRGKTLVWKNWNMPDPLIVPPDMLETLKNPPPEALQKQADYDAFLDSQSHQLMDDSQAAPEFSLD